MTSIRVVQIDSFILIKKLLQSKASGGGGNLEKKSKRTAAFFVRTSLWCKLLIRKFYNFFFKVYALCHSFNLKFQNAEWSNFFKFSQTARWNSEGSGDVELGENAGLVWRPSPSSGPLGRMCAEAVRTPRYGHRNLNASEKWGPHAGLGSWGPSG